MITNAITIGHVLLALGLIGLILIQRGKGADAGAAFGAGASGTVFGAAGSGSFLTRLTAILATLFFVTSLSLAYLAGQRSAPGSVLEQAVESAPAPANDADLLPLPGEDLPPLPELVIPEQSQETEIPEPPQ
ncbi:MAG: preprotein translocase subunit SecG [Gammaproteobacteria bacterium]|nr:preprotein translocase subunit SecG [Gammaproteobacteria bacterium]